MEYKILNNGMKTSVLGLGTWKSEPGKVGQALEYAVLQAGYRHIDCAHIYGNEKEIGEALKNVTNKITREDLFITSKLWNTEHAPERVEAACRQSLADLRLDYLDLYLIHWGIAFQHGGEKEPLDENGVVRTENTPLHDTWQAMEDLVKKGLVKSVGVANFTVPMLLDLLTYAQIKPVMNQIELHPYNTQDELIEFCKHNKIAVTAYSPLGRQGVSTVTGPRLFDDEVIKAIAADHKKTPAQILLRWAIQRGTIAIPKSTTPERISENIAIFDFSLTDREMHELSSLDKNFRFVDPVDWWGIPYFR